MIARNANRAEIHNINGGTMYKNKWYPSYFIKVRQLSKTIKEVSMTTCLTSYPWGWWRSRKTMYIIGVGTVISVAMVIVTDMATPIFTNLSMQHNTT